MLRRGLVVALCLVLVAPAVTSAQALIDRIPDDALLYVGWSGTGALGPNYEGSKTQALLNASQLKQLMDESVPRLIQRVTQEDREAGEVLNLIHTIGGQMWHHPAAIYFGGFDTTNPRMPIPRFAVLCNAGAGAPELVQHIQTVIDQIGQTPVPIMVREANGLVVLSIGSEATLKSLIGAEGAAPVASLGQKEAFTESMSKVGKQPLLAIYIDGQLMLDMVNQLNTQFGSPREQREWASIRDGLGLAGLHRIAITLGFDDQKDWAEQMYIAAPAPRKGILKLLDGPAISADTLRSIPQTSVIAAAGRFDLGGFYDELRNLIQQVSPRDLEDFDEGVTEFNEAVGLDLRNDILAPIGPEWAFYSDPNSGGTGFLGAVVVNRLSDAAKAQASLTQLQDRLNQVIASELRNEKLTVEFRQTQANGATISYFAIPFVAPAWTIHNGNLYIALYPQVIASTLAANASGKSILDNEKYTAVRQRLGVSESSSVVFYDLPSTAPGGYQSWLMLSRLALGFGDLFGLQTPPMVVPPLHAVMKNLTPAGAVAWSDDAGYYARSISPFPGAETLAWDSLSSFGVGQQAMLAAIMLPSLNRARETANRVKCASNLRQLGQGVLLYSNENRGKFPPDQAALFLTQDMGAEVFLCPSSSNSLPHNFHEMNKDEQAAWINENSSYIYLGAGKNNTADPEEILAYEHFHNHDHDGGNALYNDGHVEFKMVWQLQEELADQQADEPAQP